MRIGILHLSDVHFRDTNNPVQRYLDGIVGAVRSLGNFGAIFVTLSGDVAFSGKRSEYEKALDSLGLLQQQLKSLPQTQTVDFVAVPGNHDCNFDNVPQTRGHLIEMLSAGKIVEFKDDSIVNMLASIQDDYFAFLGALAGGEYGGTRRLGYQRQFELDGCRVVFNCFNTAWMSQKDEKQGCIVLPLEEIVKEGFDLKPAELTCAVFHHPFTWLEAENGKRFRRWLDDNCHLILTGHEHEVDQSTQRRIGGTETDYIEGGILQTDTGNESTFNVQVIDFADKTASCYQFSWGGTRYEVLKQSQPRSLHHKATLAGVFENNPKFEDYLNDLDAGFAHPVRGQLTLEDIFVYPDLRVLDPQQMATGMPYVTVPAEKLLDYVSSQMKVIVGGGDTAGKTLLLKKLYKDFRSGGYVPLLIAGTQVPSDRGKIEKFLDERVVSQYSQDKLEEYKQLDKAKKVILFDDLHKLNMGYKERCKLVVQLMDIADRIVVTTDNLVSLDELVAEGHNPFPSFKHCVLPDLGYEVRGRLIEKWVALGESQYHDPVDSVHKIKVLEVSLDNLIRNRLLASNPFTVLTALQILDGNVPSMNTVSGSYGYLYEFLITRAFGRTSREVTDIDVKYNFLSECANFMYDRALTQMSEQQINEVLSQFRKEYLVTVHEESLMRELVESRVLGFQDGSYFFRYHYIYHYFVARHMRRILSDPKKSEEAQQKLDFMVNNIHRDDCANIVILLCYLSPDPAIIERILNKARCVFSTRKPCQLQDEVAFLDKYVAKEPEVSVVESNPEQIRQLGRKAKDTFESKRPTRPAVEVSDEQRDAALFEIRVAFKTMQVMGQILKNFPGSLKGDLKLSLANECYQLGLRLLSAAMADLERDAEALIAMYMEQLQDMFPKQSPKARVGMACAFLFTFAEMCTRSVIKSISYSVGSGKLGPVYENLLEQNDSLPIQIIDITIRLDHFKTIPDAQIASAYERIKHRALPATTLKLIVIDSLMKYPPARSKRQSVLAKLGIKVLSPRLLLEAPKSRVSRT